MHFLVAVFVLLILSVLVFRFAGPTALTAVLFFGLVAALADTVQKHHGRSASYLYTAFICAIIIAIGFATRRK